MKLTHYVVKHGRYGGQQVYLSGIWDLLKEVWKWARDGRSDIITLGKQIKDI